MMQRLKGKQIILAGLAIIVLVIGFALVSRFTNNSSPKAEAAPATAPVVVALQDVPQGTTFRTGEPLATYFGVRKEPTSDLPFGAYRSVKQINSLLSSTTCKPSGLPGCQGMVTTTQTIYQNMPVLTGMFSTLGQFRKGPTGAFAIPYGYVATSVGFSDVNSVVGSVQPGDDVDLIASYTGPEGGSNDKTTPTQTQYVLNDVRVMQVNAPLQAPNSSTTSSTPASSTSDTNGGGSLVLLVSYQHALVIQHLKDFGGSWTLSCVLRSAKETDIPHFKTLPVTARWFFAKQGNHFDTSSPY
ncbi:MAG: Flp pilus assembly protein CpaB [Chloroflexota bacterium]